MKMKGANHMIAIGNDEPCPFCARDQLKAQQSDEKSDYKDVFVSTPDNSFLEHIMKEHPQDMNTFLFSNKNIGM